VLHLKDLDCTKIVQNRPTSACGNGLPPLRDLRERCAKLLERGLREILQREKRRTDPGEESSLTRPEPTR
jgi:hypothetical protein